MKTLMNSFLLVVILTGCLVTLFSVLGYWGDRHWLLDLTSHFCIAYSLFCLIAILILWLVDRHNKIHRFFRWLFFIVLAGNLIQVLQFYTPYTQPDVKPGVSLRLLQANVWVKNQDARLISTYIQEINPDLVALEEYAEYHHWFFKKLNTFRHYPFSLHDPLGKMAVYSRYPIRGHVEFAEESANSILNIRLFKNGRRITVLIAHPDRPNRGPEAARQQQLTFDVLAKLAQSSKNPVVLVGDLNTTPWSRHFQNLVANSGLRDARMGFGVRPTYPAFYPNSAKPFPMAVLPIDQILVSQGIQVLHYQVGRNVGSDHLPVLVDLKL